MYFLSPEAVIDIHDEAIRQNGGLLCYAISMPEQSMFGKHLHDTVFDKAAAYLFHIVKNHPFNDGNKRTGIAVALTFLQINEMEIKVDTLIYKQFVVDVAAGRKSKEAISAFFMEMVC